MSTVVQHAAWLRNFPRRCDSCCRAEENDIKGDAAVASPVVQRRGPLRGKRAPEEGKSVHTRVVATTASGKGWCAVKPVGGTSFTHKNTVTGEWLRS